MTKFLKKESDKMNLDKLRGKLVEHRMTKKNTAVQLGLSERSVNRRMTNRKPFTQSEISKLKKLLNLTNDEVAEIFLD